MACWMMPTNRNALYAMSPLLIVNSRPFLAMQPEDQIAIMDKRFDYDISDAFNDSHDEELTYTVSGRPIWLEFAGTQFNGTPTATEHLGLSTITVTARDSLGETASATFKINVFRPLEQDFPYIDQTASFNTTFSYSIANIFSDPENITYRTSGEPSWLTFSTINLTFSGTPQISDEIEIVSTITITAISNTQNASVVGEFTLTILNRAPILNAPLENHNLLGSQAFSYNITASDPDDPDSAFLRYEVTVTEPADDWLTYLANGDTLMFSGMPTNITHLGLSTITVTVRDSFESITTSFTLTVSASSQPLRLATATTNHEIFGGQEFSYDIAFSNPNNGTLSYMITVTGPASGPAPGWLTYTADATTVSFSGMPASITHLGLSTVTVTANDPFGGAVSTTFTITVFNQTPVLNNRPEAQTASIKGQYSYLIPADIFLDPENGPLSYTVTVTEPASNWLSFSSTDLTTRLTGMPLEDDLIGVSTVTVTATDHLGLTSTTFFTLTVITNQPPVSALEDQIAEPHLSFYYAPIFNDPEGFPILDYTAGDTSALAWLDFDTNANRFTGTPSINDIGSSAKITVTATDSRNNETSATFTITVNRPTIIPENWRYRPTEVEAGNYFRLLFITSEGFFASASDIQTWNSHVQRHAARSDEVIRPFSNKFRALISWDGVDARDNIGTGLRSRAEDIPIYWLSGHRVADNYGDLYDDSWDSRLATDEFGTPLDRIGIWTSSNSDGTERRINTSGEVGAGELVLNQEIDAPRFPPNIPNRLYAVSPLLIVNSRPTLTTPLADQMVLVDKGLSYIPTGMFNDPEGETLNFSVSGEPSLPEWLIFSVNPLAFSGTPTESTDIGITIITVTVSDTDRTGFSFKLTVPNRSPVQTTPIANQEALAGKEFLYVIPPNTFRDPDNGTLRYMIEVTDPASGWLTPLTDDTTVSFSGTPTTAEHLGLSTITVTALDSFDESITATFTINVSSRPLRLTTETTNHGIIGTQPFSYDIAFNNLNNSTLEYTVTIPELTSKWLKYSTDDTTVSFSGMPINITHLGLSTITVTAQDSFGESTSTAFTINVSSRPLTLTTETTNHEILSGGQGILL